MFDTREASKDPQFVQETVADLDLGDVFYVFFGGLQGMDPQEMDSFTYFRVTALDMASPNAFTRLQGDQPAPSSLADHVMVAKNRAWVSARFPKDAPEAKVTRKLAKHASPGEVFYCLEWRSIEGARGMEPIPESRTYFVVEPGGRYRRLSGELPAPKLDDSVWVVPAINEAIPQLIGE